MPTALPHAGRFLVAIAFGLAATLAQSAGFRFIAASADGDGPAQSWFRALLTNAAASE